MEQKFGFTKMTITKFEIPDRADLQPDRAELHSVPTKKIKTQNCNNIKFQFFY